MPADRFIHPRAGHSNKVTLLTDLEYRVWTQYLLSADDFGVMRAVPLAFQNDNDHLANRPAKLLQRCIDALVKAGLLRTFAHQGKPFIYQHDWQKWQKVEFPRVTNHPAPEDLSLCDESTRALFAKHPGGQRKDRRRSEDVPNVSQASAEGDPPTRAGTRETATANGSGSGERPAAQAPRFDKWLAEIVAAYPAQAVSGGPLTEQAFLKVFEIDRRDPAVVFAELRGAIENQKLGAQWKAGKVPKLLNWLREGLFAQRHDDIPAAPSNSKLPAWAQR